MANVEVNRSYEAGLVKQTFIGVNIGM